MTFVFLSLQNHEKKCCRIGVLMGGNCWLALCVRLNIALIESLAAFR